MRNLQIVLKRKPKEKFFLIKSVIDFFTLLKEKKNYKINQTNQKKEKNV